MDVVLGVDVGGTFTDAVLLADGSLTTAKVPTTADRSVGVVSAVEAACDDVGVDPADVSRFRHATTVAVNAMLEGTGARTALVTTAGFRDVLAIGRQDRPSLYDLSVEKPAPLVPRERRYEVDERATVDGIETRVDPGAVRDLAAEIEASDAEAVAVSFLHAYAHPANEERAATVLREELDVPVSTSSEVLPTFREYERTATTVADAAVTPVVDDYLGRLAERAADRGLPAPRVMQSNGGIADADTVREHAVTTVLSGPAAGVVGAGSFGTDLVTFDMGGTSTDVSLVLGDSAERTTTADVAGHPVRVPMVDVNTVGAGGGSVAWVDAGGALRVGPESAGADPGPACYGRGGDRPTVTDAALHLGHLASAELGAGGDVTLDADAAERVLAALADEAGLADATAAAAGVHRVATARMARAVRAVTTERGHDPRTRSLAAFGGAGPMFAAALAGRLGMERVLVPRASGVLSAFGLLAADETHDAVRTRRTPLASADADAVEAAYGDLRERVLDATSDPDAATVERAADCRYAGQGFELTVAVGTPFDPDTVRESFHEAHERAYGYRMDEPVDLVSLRVTATVPGGVPSLVHEGESVDAARTGERVARFDGERHATPVLDWSRLPVGADLSGPAVVEGGESTVVVPPSWTAAVDERGTLRLEGTDE